MLECDGDVADERDEVREEREADERPEELVLAEVVHLRLGIGLGIGIGLGLEVRVRVRVSSNPNPTPTPNPNPNEVGFASCTPLDVGYSGGQSSGFKRRPLWLLTK